MQSKGAESNDNSPYKSEEMVINGIGHSLQKKLGYRKLINIGEGNSSIKYQLECFLNLINFDEIKTKYNPKNVTLFLMVTYPTRYNRYINGKSTTIKIEEYNSIPIIKNNQKEESIYEDCLKDQSVYINTLGFICESNNWNFIWGCVDDIQSEWFENNKSVEKYIKYKLPHKYENGVSLIPLPYLVHKKMIAPCNHPNKDGYDFISNNIVSEIHKNRKELIKENLNEEYEIWSTAAASPNTWLKKLSDIHYKNI